MAITIPTITALPTPPQKSDPNNFPARADVFVAAQDNMADELNAVIVEMNKLVGGLDQSSPIAAYASGTTYNFPDVVAYTDGYTYRCIGTSVTGVTPGTDNTKWINISSIQLPVPAGEELTGGIIGGGYERTADDETTVDALSCWDENNLEEINCESQVVSIPTNTINGFYNLFACSDGTVRTDTDVDGANLSAYVKRWNGFIPTDSLGDIYPFHVGGDTIYFDDPIQMVIASDINNSYVEIDPSLFIPMERISAIKYTAILIGSLNTSAIISYDGGVTDNLRVEDASTVASNSATWWEPSSRSIYVKSSTLNRLLKVAVSAVKLRR